MKNVIIALSMIFLSCTPALQPAAETTEQDAATQPETPQNDSEDMTITITIDSTVFEARIEDSETGKAFMDKLPLTLEMSELNGNEKYCYGVQLPRADRHYDSIAAGDLMLYSGNCIVLFYGNAGGYSYTRIGKLTGTDGLKEALGTGSISVTFAKKK